MTGNALCGRLALRVICLDFSRHLSELWQVLTVLCRLYPLIGREAILGRQLESRILFASSIKRRSSETGRGIKKKVLEK